MRKFEDVVQDAEIGDYYIEPMNLYASMHNKVGIPTPQHPVYLYVMTWQKIANTAWLLHNLEHVSSFKDDSL